MSALRRTVVAVIWAACFLFAWLLECAS